MTPRSDDAAVGGRPKRMTKREREAELRHLGYWLAASSIRGVIRAGGIDLEKFQFTKIKEPTLDDMCFVEEVMGKIARRLEDRA